MEDHLIKALDFVRDNSETAEGLRGFWGLGGTGKTTLLKLVRQSAVGSFFDHVFYLEAGRDCKVTTVQNSIAQAIGLHIPSDYSAHHRVQVLHNSLLKKKFLLLLDDLWEPVDLEAVGIPRPLGGKHHRKIILSSRTKDICDHMGCSDINTSNVGCLNETDALKLFEYHVGSDTLSAHKDIPALAKQVAKLCGGFPLALFLIGRTMRNKKKIQLWWDAVARLKKSVVDNVMDKDYSLLCRLKYSFDQLDEEAQGCFLVYCWGSIYFFNEDWKKQLIKCCMGLGFLDVAYGFDGGERAIDRLAKAALLDEFGGVGYPWGESLGLILVPKHMRFVKIHDVILDMGRWIVKSSKPEERWSVLKQALLVENIENLPQKDTWCALKMLAVQSYPLSLYESIRSMANITVLDLGSYSYTRTFPRAIFELFSLEYLSIENARMDALPMELEKLTKLKHLHLRQARNLKYIPEELILFLINLEVLDLFCDSSNISLVRNKRTIPQKKKRNKTTIIPTNPAYASLHFSHLVKELTTSQQVHKVQIHGIRVPLMNTPSHDILKLTNVLSLCLLMCSSPVREYIVTRHLELLSDDLEVLAISSSDVLQKVVATPNGDNEFLPRLKVLCLEYLNTLEKVTWRNTGKNLQRVSIIRCAKLTHATWVLQLECLEHIEIAHCKEFERLIDSEELETESASAGYMIFPSLTALVLRDLPKLSNICQLPWELNKLELLDVDRCNELKYLHCQDHIEDFWRGLIPLVYLRCRYDCFLDLTCEPPSMKRVFIPY